MKWSEAVTLEFVKIYLKQECLWNPSHPGYRMKNQREKSYRIIINEFRASTSKTMTSLEVKTKIKTLRTTYSEQVHKIIERSNPDNIYEPSLIWFNEMDKHLKNIPNRRHHYKSETSLEVDAYQIPEAQETNQENMFHASSEELSSPVEHCLEPTQKHCVKKRKQYLHQKGKSKKLKCRYKPLCTYSTTKHVDKEDEFDIYGKFIASHLRKMELQRALRLQLAIQNLISEAIISDL
ncbi:hypothetical protein ACJJTC_006537 [Scirpophaga incertulas]